MLLVGQGSVGKTCVRERLIRKIGMNLFVNQKKLSEKRISVF